MMSIPKEKTVKYKSKCFAVDIVNLYKYLSDEKKEFVMSKQILRSGTSIGANVAESEAAISKKDFVSKIYIALKECYETSFWLELLNETEYISKEKFDYLIAKCNELARMLTATTKTIQSSDE